MSSIEKTLSIIKPDAVENLVEKIKDIFKNNNFNIKDSKKIHITKMRQLGTIHQSKPFYNDLCTYSLLGQ